MQDRRRSLSRFEERPKEESPLGAPGPARGFKYDTVKIKNDIESTHFLNHLETDDLLESRTAKHKKNEHSTMKIVDEARKHVIAEKIKDELEECRTVEIGRITVEEVE